MSKSSSSGLTGRLRESLITALAIFRPEQRVERPRMNGTAAPRSSSTVKCRPLNAAEMNEVERLSSMRAALYPQD